MPAMGFLNSLVTKKTSKESNDNGLILYHHYKSYYSQKVVFALAEKKLEFKTHLIDLAKSEQYQPWYMKLNPEGTVPVLKDGVKVIPDSARIIDYLEDNFSNGAPKLLPEKGSEQWINVKEFYERLDKFPVPDLSFGASFFPELCFNSKLPEWERNMRKQTLGNQKNKLNELVATYPECAELYERKFAKAADFASRVQQVENLQKTLQSLQDVLDTCETELMSHPEEMSNWWLCSEMFSLADVSLGLLLTRIHYLGFYDPYIGPNLRPCLHKYFGRIQQRDSYKMVVTQGTNMPVVNKGCSLSLYNHRKHISIALGSTALVGIIASAVIFYKRTK